MGYCMLPYMGYGAKNQEKKIDVFCGMGGVL